MHISNSRDTIDIHIYIYIYILNNNDYNYYNVYIYVHIVYRSGFSAESNLAEVFADVAGDPVRP